MLNKHAVCSVQCSLRTMKCTGAGAGAGRLQVQVKMQVQQSPNLTYSEGIGLPAAAIPVLKVVQVKGKRSVEGN